MTDNQGKADRQAYRIVNKQREKERQKSEKGSKAQGAREIVCVCM